MILVVLNRRAASHGGHDLSQLSVPAAILIILGVGLLRRQRWAIIVFIALNLLLSLVMIIGPLVSVPMPYTLVNVFLGSLFFGVGAVVFRCWRHLEA